MSPQFPFTTYRVGGCVRDALLGLPVVDRDWVVVGATPGAMRAAGFVQVGKDFPVFLHPTTREEYALARTERKSGQGYHGFVVHASPEVTLEADLARRDLTINAMAQSDDGAIIDPYGGQRDIAARTFRHVSAAFAEDPLRVLRLARFAARFADFTVAPETVALARSLAGELGALPAERVWQELARGLQEAAPRRMLDVLHDTEAWPKILPEIPTAQRVHVGVVITSLPPDIAMRYAALSLACEGKARAHALAERWKVPRECAEMADTARVCAEALPNYNGWDAGDKVDFFTRADAFRRGERFEQALHVACAFVGQTATEEHNIIHDAHAARSIDAGEVAANVPPGQIKTAVRAARALALEKATPNNVAP